jgi:hypothetical protein
MAQFDAGLWTDPANTPEGEAEYLAYRIEKRKPVKLFVEMMKARKEYAKSLRFKGSCRVRQGVLFPRSRSRGYCGTRPQGR